MDFRIHDADHAIDRLVDGLVTAASVVAGARLISRRAGPMVGSFSVPGLVAAGVGVVTWARPPLALPILYGVVLWSLLIEIIGTSITANHWLLDTALISHIGPVPATALNWTAITWLTGLGLIAAVAGLGAFQRRDLVAA